MRMTTDKMLDFARKGWAHFRFAQAKGNAIAYWMTDLCCWKCCAMLGIDGVWYEAPNPMPLINGQPVYTQGDWVE